MKSRILRYVTAMTVFAVLVTGVATAQNPVPLISQPLVPDRRRPGAAGFMLTVNGTGFVSGSIVDWDGSPRTTTFVSNSRLTASIPASDIASAETASVTVVNPRPGGGASNVVFFQVTIPSSAIGLSLSKFPSGSGTAGTDSVVTADFNGDGKLDIAAANDNDNTVSVLFGNGDGTFGAAVGYGTGFQPDSLTAADFNGDGKLDLVIRSQFCNEVSVLLGNGDGTFQPALNSTGSCDAQLAVGDFNRDGKPDLACTSGNNNTVSVLLGNGDGTFQNEVSYASGTNPYGLAVGDFDGDGRLDLAIASISDNAVSVLLGNGDGTFQGHVEYATGSGPQWVGVADLNGDGTLDLVVTNKSSSTVSVLVGNGDGSFRAHVDYPVPAGADRSDVADLNGDGKLDLIVTAREKSNNVSILFGNGDGTLQSPLVHPTGPSPLGLVVGDFNGDGRLDLAIANVGDSSVSVLLQTTIVSLSSRSLTFADQVVGTSSAAQTVTLFNASGLTLTISSIGVTGTNASDFSQTNTCGTSLPAKGSCTITVTFTPTQVGPRTASVTIADNTAGSPQAVALTGTGVVSGPNVTLSATSLTFATQLVNTTSPAQPVTLTNYGTSTLTITSILASGDFAELTTCGSSLAAGTSCTISLTFKPTQRGTRTGTLSITDNAPGNPQEVSLTGTGTVVQLNPTSLNLGIVWVGQSSSKTTTLTNSASTALSISGITITGAFSQTNTCGNSVVAKGSCTITVTFKPGAAGSFSGAVSVSDNGGGSPQQVPLSGLGKRIK